MFETHIRPLFDSERFRSLRTASSELLAVIRSLVSAPMREAEAGIAARIRARPFAGSEIAGDHRQEIEDILVAREMARIDLGIDVLLSQPRH
jgi:hypothetical protein